MTRILTDEDEMAAFNKACDLEQRRLGLTVREELLLICDYIMSEGLGACEYVMGQTNDGGGEPCRKMGIYRESCELILCDKCYRRMQ